MNDSELIELIKNKLKDEELPENRLSQETIYVIAFIRGIEYYIDVYSKRPA